MRKAEAFAALHIDGHEAQEPRRRVWLRFSSDLKTVDITRRLKFTAPANGAVMVIFHQKASGDDWWMKRYIGAVTRGDTITCRPGVQAGALAI